MVVDTDRACHTKRIPRIWEQSCQNDLRLVHPYPEGTATGSRNLSSVST